MLILKRLIVKSCIKFQLREYRNSYITKSEQTLLQKFMIFLDFANNFEANIFK